ncbi:MAG: sugar ABC transporter substrate-binding protein, partial [Haloarcula sp.]
MTMERRTVLKRIGGVSMAAALAGCSVQEQGSNGADGESGAGDGSSSGSDGGSQQSGGTATAWYQLQDSELPAREAAIETFTSETEFGVDGADISNMEKKTTSAIPAGQGPEIFEWAHDWVGDY